MKGYWITAGGRQLRIVALDSGHLLNILAMLERNCETSRLPPSASYPEYDELLEEAYRRQLRARVPQRAAEAVIEVKAKEENANPDRFELIEID